MNPFSDRKWGRGMFRRADSLHTVEKCNAFVSKLHTRTYGTGNAWISHVSQDCSIFPRLEWCTLFLARLVWKKALGIGNIESYSLSLSLSTSALFVLDSRVFPLTKRKLFPSSSLFSHARLFRSLVILFHAAYRMRPPTFLLELGSFYREGGRRESRRTILREIFISRTIRNDLWSWESSCVRDDDGETERKQWMNEYNLFLREKSKRNIWFSLRRIHRIHEDKNIIILKMGP